MKSKIIEMLEFGGKKHALHVHRLFRCQTNLNRLLEHSGFVAVKHTRKPNENGKQGSFLEQKQFVAWITWRYFL